MRTLSSKQFSDILKEYGLLLIMALLVIVVTILEPRFLNPDNLFNIMRQIAVLGLVSVGLTVVVMSGYMDLSVPGIINLCGILIVALQEKMAFVPSLILILLIGVCTGLVNAGIIILIRARNGESLMVTYGISSVFTTIALLYTKGFAMRAPSDSNLRLIGQGTVGPIANSIILFALLAAFMEFFMKHTRAGRQILLIGANREASRLSAIPVNLYIMLTYVISGTMSSIAAVALASRTMTANSSMGLGYDMDAIMAVVIGGTSLTGGRGSVLRTIVGVILVGAMSNAMNIIGIDSNSQFIVKGLIMVIAIWIDSKRGK